MASLFPSEGRPARHIKKLTEEIYRTWIGLGECPMNQLAFYVYRNDYSKANSKERKKLRDRCRQAIERCQKRAT